MDDKNVEVQKPTSLTTKEALYSIHFQQMQEMVERFGVNGLSAEFLQAYGTMAMGQVALHNCLYGGNR
jgi:hypothetical protein